MKVFAVILFFVALVFVASATTDEVQSRISLSTFKSKVAELKTRYAKIRANYGLQIESIMYCVTPDIATEGCITSIYNCATASSLVGIPDCLNVVACAGLSLRSCVSRYWSI